jgi:hypothetical protein
VTRLRYGRFRNQKSILGRRKRLFCTALGPVVEPIEIPVQLVPRITEPGRSARTGGGAYTNSYSAGTGDNRAGP